MSKKIQKKIEGLLFEIYDNGVQHNECDLTSYFEKIKQALNIPVVVGRSEQLKALLEKLLEENMCSVAGDELIEEALKGF